MPCSLFQFTQLLRKVPGISSEPPPSLKTLGPWENKHCLVTAWLRALGDSEMSLAVLARLNCWETGLQKHRAGQHAWAPLKYGSRGGRTPPLSASPRLHSSMRRPARTHIRNRGHIQVSSGMPLQACPAPAGPTWGPTCDSSLLAVN